MGQLVEVDLFWCFVVKGSVRFAVVVFSEAGHGVESWVVELECLPEPFNLPLRCGFSSGTENMLNAMLRAVVGESPRTVVAPELRPMI